MVQDLLVGLTKQCFVYCAKNISFLDSIYSNILVSFTFKIIKAKIHTFCVRIIFHKNTIFTTLNFEDKKQKKHVKLLKIEEN